MYQGVVPSSRVCSDAAGPPGVTPRPTSSCWTVLTVSLQETLLLPAASASNVEMAAWSAADACPVAVRRYADQIVGCRTIRSAYRDVSAAVMFPVAPLRSRSAGPGFGLLSTWRMSWRTRSR